MSLNQIESLGEYTFVSRYAKYLPEKKRRENLSESVARYKKFMSEQYAGCGIEEELDFACEAYKETLALGAQRALQFAGDALKRNNCRSYNCWASYCDRVRFFQETMFILLSGGGTGFSVERLFVNNLPEFVTPRQESKIFSIPDSIEGWSDAIGVLIASFLGGPEFTEYHGCEVIFDYSKIRPEGSPFSHGIGKAPGHKPLENAIEKIRLLLNSAVLSGRSRLRPIECYDIIMHSADAVLSGGIRRSATIVIFDRDDQEMMTAKTGNWFIENPQRGRSNNSCRLIRGQVTWEQFNSIIQYTKQYGEPGFFWADNEYQIPNPCLEINFFCYDSDGKSGWQACNLTTQNGKKIKNKQDWIRAVTAATMLGTFQAGLTNFSYLGKTTENICKREALLGVSLTGWMENPKLLLDQANQKEMAKLAKEVNEKLAKKIKINPAARITCVKPEGTTSTMLGTSSGIHPHHSRKFIRRIQENKLSRPAQYYKSINPIAVEESVWCANNSDVVLSFACEVPQSAIIKSDISAIEFLKIVKETQENWVWEGKNQQHCVDSTISNNVSNTCIVKQDEWDAVARYIFDNQTYFTGVSLLSDSGDKDYAQAPFTKILSLEEIVAEYGQAALFTSGLIEEGLVYFNGNLWAGCDCVLSKGENLENHKSEGDYKDKLVLNKTNWVKRVKKFASRYFKGDLIKTTYLLKDIYNLKFYLDLQKNYKTINWEDMVEEENTTLGTKEVACAGGSCLI